jgi:hypothetical protein
MSHCNSFQGFIYVAAQHYVATQQLFLPSSRVALQHRNTEQMSRRGHPPKPAFYTYAVVPLAYPGLFFIRSPSRKISGLFLGVHLFFGVHLFTIVNTLLRRAWFFWLIF